MIQLLTNYLKAGFPGIAIQTHEEARALDDIIQAAKALKMQIITWSATEGLQNVSMLKSIPDSEDLVPACRYREKETAVYIFRDVQTWAYDRDPILARSLKDLLVWAPTAGSAIIFLGSQFKSHPSFEKLVTIVDYSLPNEESLNLICKGIAESANKKIPANSDVIRALSGLSTAEAENALALSLVESGSFNPDVIYREKIQSVKRSGLLEIVNPDPRGLEAIGGLDELKNWVVKRKRAFSPEAAEFGLPAPKGLLLVGVPGSGKSLSAKSVGTALGVPTIRLDIGSLFNSLVGESESRTRDALKLAEAMAPCVLWVDEIDKGLAGSSGGSGDSGVTRRVFGTIISWMQERARPVFLVATANQVEGLPPELLRKGRFDEIFAIDLPDAIERHGIFKIHLQLRNRNPKNFDLDKLSSVTDGFTGSEIENSIIEALYNAFDLQRDIGTTDIVNAVQSTTPLSVTAKEQIESIRVWAKTRARFASQNHVESKGSKSRKLNLKE